MSRNRAALVALATQLNEARFAANAIPETEAQSGVYGQIEKALDSVMSLLLFEDEDPAPIHHEVVMQALLDHCTVREALRAAYCDLNDDEVAYEVTRR